MAAAVRAGVPPPSTEAERLQQSLAHLSCGACHEREGLPGPAEEVRGYFQVERGLDLGDQGRLPPTLTRVGAKLEPAWFEEVLAGRGRVRPYLRTRMPHFGAANTAALPALFAAVDASFRDEREPPFSPAAVEAGRELAGTKGLGCIQCHEFAGHPSIGIPAVDLATVYARIHPGWFRELLMDPAALQMNTRMPAFWVEGKSPVTRVLGGDPSAQVDALWTYLSLGSSMPLPHGLVPLEGEYEVEVYDTPVCVGVFLAGVSPRAVAVGLPERVHYAFDVEHSRLALAWRGRFLDARGTWHGRAGELEEPAGDDVLEFPPGFPLAVLARADDPWPVDGLCTLARPDGRTTTSERRPAWRYSLGGLHVIESPRAVLSAGGARLARALSFRRERSAEVVYVRLAVGRSIEAAGEGAWKVAAGRALALSRVPATAFVVDGQEGAELRFPLDFEGEPGADGMEACQVEVEYSW